MIARVSRGTSGFGGYLDSGKSNKSNFSRDEKDTRVPLFGNLELWNFTEKYLVENKNYSDNYLHISISFSDKDWMRLSDLTEDELDKALKDIIIKYIKHHTSGYDIDNEVIAYAEMHLPKIKEELDLKSGKLKTRKPHIHLGIMMYNPLSDRKLITLFAADNFNDDLLQASVNNEYGFTHPHPDIHISSKKSIKKDQKIQEKLEYKTRAMIAAEMQNIQTYQELLNYCKINNFALKNTKNKFTIPKGEFNPTVNLRGINFPHIEKIFFDRGLIVKHPKALPRIRKDDQKAITKRLDEIYHRRTLEINKRRSKKTTQDLEKIRKAKSEVYTIPGTPEKYTVKSFDFDQLTKQQQIYFEIYQKILNQKILNTYFITNKNNEVSFISKKKKVDVVDKGAQIAAKGSNNKEQIKLMIEIAVAKKWDLTTMDIKGDDSFILEAKMQIAAYLKAQKYDNPKIEKPNTSLQQLGKKIDEKIENEKANKDISLGLLKKTLSANEILKYAHEKYKIDLYNYEITSDNKINNKSNRQKPKNIIDFLQKEIHLSAKESINICKNINNGLELHIQELPKNTRVNSSNQNLSQHNQGNCSESMHAIDHSVGKIESGSSSVKIGNRVEELKALLLDYKSKNTIELENEIKNRLKVDNVKVEFDKIIIDDVEYSNTDLESKDFLAKMWENKMKKQNENLEID